MKDSIKIPAWLAPLLVTALFSVEAWTLTEVIALKAAVTGLSARVEDLTSGAKQIARH